MIRSLRALALSATLLAPCSRGAPSGASPRAAEDLGADASQRTAGAAPVGVASAAVDGRGHLILTLTNGATTDAGALPAGDAAGARPFAGNGSPAGTPLFLVLDAATGNASYVTAEGMQALLAGGRIAAAPQAPGLVLGPATAHSVAYTISPAASPGSDPAYQVDYRVAGSSDWLPTGPASAALTGTITGLSGSTAYEVEAVAATAGGTAVSTVSTVTTQPAPGAGPGPAKDAPAPSRRGPR